MDPSLIRGSHAGGAGRYDGRRPDVANLPLPSFGGGDSVGAASARQGRIQGSPFETGPRGGAVDGGERARLAQRAIERGTPGYYGGGVLGKAPQERQSAHVQSVAAMVVVPWLTFVGVCAATAFAPPGDASRAAVWVVSAACLAFSLLLLQVYVHSRALIYKYLGGLGVLAVALGFFCGTTIYESTVLQYWLNHSRATVSGVAPSQPAVGYANAAAITFTPGTRVDLARSFGYRAADEGGAVYCVAPVLDAAAAELDEVRVWAVGMDCCAPTWGFRCGAALSPDARSGVVLRKLAGSRSASARYRYFQKASVQASALYHLRTAEEPVFVRWAEDAIAEVSRDLGVAVVWVVVLGLLHLMASLLLAGLLHWQSGRARHAWQRAAPGLGAF